MSGWVVAAVLIGVESASAAPVVHAEATFAVKEELGFLHAQGVLCNPQPCTPKNGQGCQAAIPGPPMPSSKVRCRRPYWQAPAGRGPAGRGDVGGPRQKTGLEAIPSFLPAVYLLGEQKASSSSLYTLMSYGKTMCGGHDNATEQPGVEPHDEKEPHFWDVLDSMYGSELAADPKWFEHQGHQGRGAAGNRSDRCGLRHDKQRHCDGYGPDAPPVAAVSEGSLRRAYGKLYDHCEPKREGAAMQPRRLTVDATPKYLRFIGDTLFDRMAATYARFGGTKPKFIVVIREPVSRALSWWNHITRYQKGYDIAHENCSLDGALVSRARNFTQFARCEHHIYNYRVGARLAEVARLFGRDRLLVLTTDMVQHHTASAMQAIALFLRVPFSKQWRWPLPHGNSGHNSQSIDRVPCRTLRWLRDMFVEDQARLEALASGPGRPRAQPPYARPTLPETQKCLLDGGKVGTVGRPTRR